MMSCHFLVSVTETRYVLLPLYHRLFFAVLYLIRDLIFQPQPQPQSQPQAPRGYNQVAVSMVILFLFYLLSTGVMKDFRM
jgi:hypothetical protein